MLNRVIVLIVVVCLFFNMPSTLAQSKTNVDSLLNILSTTQSDTLKIKILNGLAKALRNKETGKALEYATQANKLSIEQNYDLGLAYSSDILGVINLQFGDSRKALYYHFIALQIFKKRHDFKGESFALNNIGAVYAHLKNYKKAKQYYQMSLVLKRQLGFYKEVSSSLINLGNIEMSDKHIAKCISYYLLALKNAVQYNDTNNIVIANINLGEAYIDAKNYNKALAYYKQALKLSELTGVVFHKAHIKYALGKIYTKLDKGLLAENSFEEAIILARKIDAKPLLLNIYKYYAALCKKQQNYHAALLLNEQFLSLNDTLYNQENAKNINEMQARFDLKEKEEQIKSLNIQREVVEMNNTKEKLLRNLLIMVVVFVSLITFIVIRLVIVKQRSNKILTIKNKLIEEQQNEIKKINVVLENNNRELMKENISAKYEILKSKINPHFLFNSLSTLSSLIIEDKKVALEFLTKFSKLYRSIMEHGNTSLVTIASEIEVVDSYIYLNKIKYLNNLVVHYELDDAIMDALIVPFGMQLLIENAIKHNIISSHHPLTIIVSIADDKIVVKNSVRKKVNEGSSMGLGQKSIIERYKMLTYILPTFEVVDGWYIAQIPILGLK